MRRRLKYFAVIAALHLAAAASAQNIDTTGVNGGLVGPFGYPNTATVGQTFLVSPSAGSIDSFSLFLQYRESGSGPLDLRGYLATWDGTHAVDLLYTSPIVTMNANGDLQEFSFNTPGVDVTPNESLVAFLSVSDLGIQPESTFAMQFGADEIPGSFVFINSGTDFDSLFTNAWTTNWLGTTDAWIRVNFGSSSVPEPSTWLIMLFGFGLIGGAMRPKHNRRIALS